MKTDTLVIAVHDSDIDAINYVCDLMEDGYILVSRSFNKHCRWTEYHLRKTPFTTLMTKLSKKI